MCGRTKNGGFFTTSPNLILNPATVCCVCVCFEGVDSSHRGGRPGFVEVLNDTTIQWPDYSGNNMFATVGNLAQVRFWISVARSARSSALQLRILYQQQRCVFQQILTSPWFELGGYRSCLFILRWNELWTSDLGTLFWNRHTQKPGVHFPRAPLTLLETLIFCHTLCV